MRLLELPGDELALIVPWAAGEALDQGHAGRAWPVDEALAIGWRLAESLGKLHTRGVCHGDVQPSNVVVGDEGPALIDLGAAWRPASEAPSEEAWGRAGYLAPERIDGQGGGPASDVFSLGCVLVEMMTGEPPFGRDGAAALGRTLLGERTPLASLPAFVREVLDRMLAREVDARPGDGEAAASLLAGAARQAFVLAQTAPVRPAFVPEVTLLGATEVTPLWHATESWLQRRGIEPPFWAFAWAGGQALARCVLDQPGLVRGRRVVDLACGGGLVAIAAALAGASRVEALDIDPLAVVACRLNAARNAVAVTARADDVVGQSLAGVDVLLAGDVFYDAAISARLWPWLRAVAASGVQVLVGDPGRAYAPTEGVIERARYEVPTPLDLEGITHRTALVLEVIGQSS